MRVQKVHRDQIKEPKGLFIVIDVLRAFTTAAFAFSKGVKEIIMVSKVEKAFLIQENHPDFFMMGEVDGKDIDGFHFGNSPGQFEGQSLFNKTLIQRTSSGTQGIVQSVGAEKILASSFVVAEPTLKRVSQLNIEEITFVITGSNNGDEDASLADYLEQRILSNEKIDVNKYLEIVIQSPLGKSLAQDSKLASDLKKATQFNKFPFAMEIFDENDFLILRPVDSFGRRWKVK